MEACNLQTLLGPEGLSQVRLPIHEGGFGLTSSANIRRAAYVGCQTLVLARVVTASAIDELAAFLRRLPNRSTMAGLVTELKEFAELAKQS